MRPLKALLTTSAELYPAIPGPLLRVLTLTIASPASARAAYDFFQHRVGLVCAHPLGEPAIHWAGAGAGSKVAVRTRLPWSRAPRIAGLALPEVSHPCRGSGACARGKRSR